MLVMIIGAGPSGLRAASGLKRLGIPTLLVDPSPAGGALNGAYNYENSRTCKVESSLDLKCRLLAPWGDSGPSLINDRVVSATWQPSGKTWDVQLVRSQRTVSWIFAATGAPDMPDGKADSHRPASVTLIVDGKNLALSDDGRYPDMEGRDLPWQVIGDARAGAPSNIDDAIFSANAAIARVANALRPYAKYHL